MLSLMWFLRNAPTEAVSSMYRNPSHTQQELHSNHTHFLQCFQNYFSQFNFPPFCNSNGFQQPPPLMYNEFSNGQYSSYNYASQIAPLLPPTISRYRFEGANNESMINTEAGGGSCSIPLLPPSRFLEKPPLDFVNSPPDSPPQNFLSDVIGYYKWPKKRFSLKPYIRKNVVIMPWAKNYNLIKVQNNTGSSQSKETSSSSSFSSGTTSNNIDVTGNTDSAVVEDLRENSKRPKLDSEGVSTSSVIQSENTSLPSSNTRKNKKKKKRNKVVVIIKPTPSTIDRNETNND